jgi:hypothetical protein
VSSNYSDATALAYQAIDFLHAAIFPIENLADRNRNVVIDLL